jgi:hypothetical protein
MRVCEWNSPIGQRKTDFPLGTGQYLDGCSSIECWKYVHDDGGHISERVVYNAVGLANMIS